MGCRAFNTLIFAIMVIIALNKTHRAFGAGSEESSCVFKDEAGTTRWRCVCRSFETEGFVPHLSEAVFSPNLRRVAYTACSSLSRGPDYVVVDGKKGKMYDEVGCIVFSPDSSRLAYAASKGDEYFVVLDGVEGPHYDDDILEIVFSPDSKRLAYQSARSYKDVLILDGQEVSVHDWLSCGDMVFSPDSRHFAYSAKDNGKHALFLDGKRLSDDFDELQMFSLKFSPDSKKIAYVCRRGQNWFVVYGNATYGPYDEVESIFLVISLDSQRFAFPARRGTHWFLICGEKEYGPYGVFPHPLFSPDSKSLACFGGHEKNVPVYLNGQILGTFDEVYDATFSPDSKHFAFTGCKNNWCCLIVDGTIVTEGDAVPRIVYSPDSNRLVAVRTRGPKEYLFEGGREGKLYDMTTWGSQTAMCFSPDSKYLSYWGRLGDEDVLLIDGFETLRFTGERNPELVFTENNHLYGAGWHVTEKVQPLVGETADCVETVEKRLPVMRLTLFHMLPGKEKR